MLINELDESMAKVNEAMIGVDKIMSHNYRLVAAALDAEIMEPGLKRRLMERVKVLGQQAV